MIFLNFVGDDGTIGCRFKCKFCCWANSGFNKRLCPTNEEITEYLNTYFPRLLFNEQPLEVHISGGGDPLYDYDTNKQELLRIIKCIKSFGCTISIVTREMATIAKH